MQAVCWLTWCKLVVAIPYAKMVALNPRIRLSIESRAASSYTSSWVVVGWWKTRSNAKTWAARPFHACICMVASSGNVNVEPTTISLAEPSSNSRLLTGRKRQMTRTLQSDAIVRGDGTTKVVLVLIDVLVCWCVWKRSNESDCWPLYYGTHYRITHYQQPVLAHSMVSNPRSLSIFSCSGSAIRIE